MIRGKEICDKLSKLKKGSTVEVTMGDFLNPRKGVYEIQKIEIPLREVTDRVIYRFSGELKPVY